MMTGEGPCFFKDLMEDINEKSGPDRNVVKNQNVNVQLMREISDKRLRDKIEKNNVSDNVPLEK